MAITPLPALDRTSATFKTDLDDFFLTDLPTFSTEAEAARVAIVASQAAAAASASTATTQAVTATTQAGTATTQAAAAAASAASALNAPGTSATSTTSTAIGTGSKTVTIQTGKAFSVGQTVVLASAANVANQMIGQITAHNSGTGSLTVNVSATGGSGTYTDWVVSLAAALAGVGNHAVFVTTGNGHGSTNTKIRRFTTTQSSSGTDISYADSATLGASFTINADGLYAMIYCDAYSVASHPLGISVNSAQLTTSIASITAANRLGMTNCLEGGMSNSISLTSRLVAGDVIRAHDGGLNDYSTGNYVYFSILKVGS